MLIELIESVNITARMIGFLLVKSTRNLSAIITLDWGENMMMMSLDVCKKATIMLKG